MRDGAVAATLIGYSLYYRDDGVMRYLEEVVRAKESGGNNIHKILTIPPRFLFML